MQKVWNLPRVDYLSLSEHVDPRLVVLVYSDQAWGAVEPHLTLDIACRLPVEEATLTAWERMAAEADGQVVYAVGGGLAADAAKLIATRRELPLIVIPTAISVDAPFTWASGYREHGAVRYLETRVPDRLLVDLDVISRAPDAVRAAGITDVLSIATGAWDWRFADEQGRNPAAMPYLPWADRIAMEILDLALDAAEEAGRGRPDALRTLLDTLALEVQLCNQLGHSRPEEGSEHYFAYAVENHLGKGLPHGDLVGPGIVVMAALQGQPVDRLVAALRACHVPLDRIPRDVIRTTLRELPDYCAR
ncbi:MAG: iron-containing alcohol dehydrogenase, partial [Pseudomonadota bacterium]